MFRYISSPILLCAASIFIAFAQHPAKAEELTIVGTGDGFATLNALANAFNATHATLTVKVPSSIGSSGGIKTVGNGHFVLGRVARKIKDNEQGYGLTYRPFAKLPIVFFVNESVSIDNLTTDQILKIYGGQITNWRDVGGDNGKIRVVRREDGDSSIRNLRRTLPGFDQLAITAKSKTTTNTQENIDIVKKTPGTIGFGPYPDARRASVKVLSIDDKIATSPHHPYFTVLALIFKAENNKGAVAEFIDFLSTETAQRTILEYGGLPY